MPAVPVNAWATSLATKAFREYAAIYHGMVKYMDDQIGRILKRLDEFGPCGKDVGGLHQRSR